MKKKRRGAPYKPPERRKSNAVRVRLSDAEKAACEVTAERLGTKMSTWARKTLMAAVKAAGVRVKQK